MKTPLLLLTTMLCAGGALAQEHFTGISTSRRGGLLNASLNPAELVNQKTAFDVNLFNFGINVANNKISFGDIVSGDDFDRLIFEGNEPTNLRLDAKILGPSLSLKRGSWAFAFTTGANVKADFVDVDTNLGNAVTNGNIAGIIGTYDINAGYNQRVSGTSWGEIGFTLAHDFFNNDLHKFSAGVTGKLLFPGTYANIALGQFRGRIDNVADNVYLNDASANINIAYSGSLAEDFTDSGSFTKFFAGGLNGFAADFGVNYQLKDRATEGSSVSGYRLNAGASVRNLGSMTFKDDNNQNTDYALNIPNGVPPAGLNLNQFEDVSDVREIETILRNSGYLTGESMSKDFTVKLPATLSLYADVKIVNRLYFTAFTQQRLSDDNDNEQITSQRIWTFTPRYSTEWFEAYVPITNSDISDTNVGLGFRLGGFFLGSGSIITAALSDANQADIYFGFRFGL
ncbi:MAG: DUF5723 family protein [Flavobacterium sp.]